ncbi:MAG: hypothetical protein CVU59_12725 [Deltaproteobacteria bacterium HGW-Deltaproteobacteria-17]|nr:MAG: hypothetical protein CVU59_12725 [Deltaproteobacteria bacterium HGW-Deltaproteobacteria-17]
MLFNSIRPSLAEDGNRLAARYLNEPETRLFTQMGRYDRSHSLLVAERCADSPRLVRAALLHDCGKLASELPLWFRNLYTALEILAPAWLSRRQESLAEGLPEGSAIASLQLLPGRWPRALFAQSHHGKIGAELLEALGCELEVTYLVRYHQGAVDPVDAELRRFIEADSAF